jgi:4-hydroxybutyrate CoA-transferase
MSWHDEYDCKRTTADDALGVVRSGNNIWIQPNCSVPDGLVRALLRRAPELRNVQIVQMLTFGDADYVRPEYEGRFRVNSLFTGANIRGAVQEGRADYTPIFLSEIEDLLISGAIPLDVVLLSVSPPDEHGFMSLGTGVDCTLTAARYGRRVIAEVNSQVPRTHGDAFLHVSEVAAIVENDHPLREVAPPAPTEVHHRIAAYVASLIPDGATLQTGIGGIPDAVLSCLDHHKDLGIHTEMFSDGVIPLIEAGVINGRRKTLHRGKLVAGFVIATHRTFDYIDDNPLFEFHPIRYTNDPFVIAQNDSMVAINSALQVDLTGQVCADSIGTRPYSGFGGQVDFIRGAARSKGGKPIIAMPATAKDGTVSRIAPVLDPGAGVVTSRADVHYVVTEHGIAYLHGKTLRQRAEALIAIAEPKFRDGLYDFACRAHYLEPARGVLA